MMNIWCYTWCCTKLRTLYYDNLSAISISKYPVQHAHTKHVDIWHYFIQTLVENKTIDLHHVSTNDQLANKFTKGLNVFRFESLWSSLGLCVLQTSLKSQKWKRPTYAIYGSCSMFFLFFCIEIIILAIALNKEAFSPLIMCHTESKALKLVDVFPSLIFGIIVDQTVFSSFGLE